MDPHQSYNPYVNVKLNPPDLRERVPQWTQAETAELLAIRGELDASFLETKRNKPLWEAVAARMHVKGFPRTPDQCKSKWKNLLTRFKGSEAMEAETSRQFPFHEEMQRIFSGRMDRLLNFEDEKGKESAFQAAEESEEEEEAEATKRSSTSKKRIRRKRGDEEDQSVKSLLKKMMTWQKEMEERMLRDWEMRENERRLMENQWRRSMQALQEERMVMEQQWRAREEERRARAEERAEHRHQLITAILNKLAEKGL